MEKKKIILNFTGRAATPEELCAGVAEAGEELMQKIRKLLTLELKELPTFKLPSVKEVEPQARGLLVIISEYLADLKRQEPQDEEIEIKGIMIDPFKISPALLIAFEIELLERGIRSIYDFDIPALY